MKLLHNFHLDILAYKKRKKKIKLGWFFISCLYSNIWITCMAIEQSF